MSNNTFINKIEFNILVKKTMATDIEKLIIKHNKDAQNRKLVTFYDRKSTMEKMGIARSETAHSAFLANILKCED